MQNQITFYLALNIRHPGMLLAGIQGNNSQFTSGFLSRSMPGITIYDSCRPLRCFFIAVTLCKVQVKKTGHGASSFFVNRQIFLRLVKYGHGCMIPELISLIMTDQ